MAEFKRSELRKIFEEAEITVPKDVIGQICDLHTSSVEEISDSLKETKKQLAAAEQERDDAKAKAPKEGEETVSKEKFDKVSNEFAAFKKTVETEKTEHAKDKALRNYFKEQGFTSDDIDIAIRGCAKEKEKLELDGDKFKDTSSLDELVKGVYSRFKTSTKSTGVTTATPPAAGSTKKTKEQIAAIKDPEERRTAIAENIELFQ